jgi:hypothetical protein
MSHLVDHGDQLDRTTTPSDATRSRALIAHARPPQTECQCLTCLAHRRDGADRLVTAPGKPELGWRWAR